MQTEDRIAGMITPLLDALGFALVRVRFAADTLQIMAEPAPDENGESRTMTVDDCADISRAVSQVLDAEDPIKTAYTLEVSSPGLARPLTRREDYARFNGAAARIETATLINGRRRFRGMLSGMTEAGAVLIETDDGMQSVPFEAIEKARLDPAAFFENPNTKKGAKKEARKNAETKPETRDGYH